LAAIGIDVDVRCLPGDQFYARYLSPGAPWDLAIDGWSAVYGDASDFIGALGSAGSDNVANFHDANITRLQDQAAPLSGLRRALAYARIDTELVRDAAPLAVFANERAHALFSTRMGCQIYQPVYGIDLAALCLRSDR
jgi:ABC-type oligopeptide transport system substrate-binding subunit